jgi:hypothetical protein
MAENTSGAGHRAESVTVAVVGICSAAHIERCLAALAVQEGAPPFDVVVVYDPHLDGVPATASRHPGVRFVSNEGQRTPLELAARAVREAHGELVFLTEDHCIPRRDWVRRLHEAQAPDRGAVGGVVETDPDATPVDWAFYYVDFFRYMPPVEAGPSPTLTVCNVSYRRRHLDRIASLWESFFHETAINDALRSRFGPLWLAPEAEVRMRRSVRFGDAVYERYAFGRLFACTRLEFAGAGKRLMYSLLAPGLPILLMGRMTGKAFRSPAALPSFVRALPALTAMVLAWSWGEWLGYLTRRRPSSLVVAPEIRQARRGEQARAVTAGEAS